MNQNSWKHTKQVDWIRSFRFLVIVTVSLLLLVTNIASAKSEFTYKILYSSDSIDHWEVKNTVLEVFDTLTTRVNEDYYYEIISQGIHKFEIVENSTAKLDHTQIVITLGDGKGITVAGTFQKQCTVEVKRKSIILDLLGQFNK